MELVNILKEKYEQKLVLGESTAIYRFKRNRQFLINYMIN